MIVASSLALLTFFAVLLFSNQRFGPMVLPVVDADVAPAAAPINQLFVFGDSLSATGTRELMTEGMNPSLNRSSYLPGRYANGRVWVEYLADHLALSPDQTANFAQGGATTDGDRARQIPGLLAQVQALAAAQPQLNPQALYVFWAGANDYLQGTTQVSALVENITTAIARLTDIGAERFLVANLPDLGQLPATRNNANAMRLSELTQTYNQALRRSLTALGQQQPERFIIQLDVNTLYGEAIANPSAFGFANVTDACLSGTEVCNQPEQFLFWDGIHPTTASHQILGKAAFDAVRHAGLKASV